MPDNENEPAVDSVQKYYDSPSATGEGLVGAGLIWLLGRDHLSPSYDNSDEVALDATKWREGAKKRCLGLAQAMGITHGSKVLDVGSGIGGPGRDIQSATDCWLIGANLSLNQLRSSRKLSELEKPENPRFLDLTQAHALWLPFPPSFFDFVYSVNVFYHIPNVAWAIEEVERVLKLGGKFGLDDWFLTDKAGSDTRERELVLRGVPQLVSIGLTT